MADVAGLGARMGLVALVTSFHARPVRAGRKGVVLNVAMTLDAERFLLRVKLVGDFHDPDVLRLHLLAPGDGGVAAETIIGHHIITGKKLPGDDLSGPGMAFRAGHRCRMAAGGEPHLGSLLIAMTAETEKGVARGETHQAQGRDGCQDQNNHDDKCPGPLG